MNTARVIRFDPTHEGLKLRLWVDDEKGRHLATAEVFVPATTLAIWWVGVRAAEDEHNQLRLDFDV